ncbi:MAG: peptide chain release factor N(5)-glutamine methyltransferase [Nitrospiraceae bacterium]
MMDALASVETNEHDITLSRLLQDGRLLLADAGIEQAEREVMWILEAALATTAVHIRLDQNRVLLSHHVARARKLFSRRAAREPLQYVLGSQEFCGLDFEVTSSVLIPRPETELLVEEVVRHLPSGVPCTIVDIGTGSGCIAVALARMIPLARVYGVDSSRDALQVAQRNSRRLDVQDQVSLLQGDLLVSLNGLEGKVDVIVSNPPYIAEADLNSLQPEVCLYEPRLALVGGADGLHFYRQIVRQAGKYLRPGGLLAIEVGHEQANQILELIRRRDQYDNIRTRRDAAEIPRILCAQRSS